MTNREAELDSTELNAQPFGIGITVPLYDEEGKPIGSVKIDTVTAKLVDPNHISVTLYNMNVVNITRGSAP
jgi:hypothetical protein